MNTVSQLIDEVGGILTGVDVLNNTTNLDAAIARGVRNFIQQAYVPEATGRQNYMIYDGVFDYLAPPLIFSSLINDFRPQGITRQYNDMVFRRQMEIFDREKLLCPSGYLITFEYRNGVPIMRVAQTNATQKTVVDDMTEITGWVTSGVATNLVEDQTVYYQSPSALRYGVSGAGVATLTKTLTYPMSIASYQGVAVGFLALRVDDTANIANLTNIQLILGSSPTNYVSLTQTTGFLGAFTIGNFILVAFNLALATTVGTPNFGAINYVQINTATGGAIPNIWFGGLFLSLPSPFELLYQSSAIFSGAAGLSNNIKQNSDYVILGDAAYNILVYEVAMEIALQNGGTFGNGVVSTINGKLHGMRAKNGTVIQLGLYDLYRADNPSEELTAVGSWYD